MFKSCIVTVFVLTIFGYFHGISVPVQKMQTTYGYCINTIRLAPASRKIDLKSRYPDHHPSGPGDLQFLI